VKGFQVLMNKDSRWTFSHSPLTLYFRKFQYRQFTW